MSLVFAYLELSRYLSTMEQDSWISVNVNRCTADVAASGTRDPSGFEFSTTRWLDYFF